MFAGISELNTPSNVLDGSTRANKREGPLVQLSATTPSTHICTHKSATCTIHERVLSFPSLPRPHSGSKLALSNILAVARLATQRWKSASY